MRIAMINGSPKSKPSTSGILLQELKTCFAEKVTFEDFLFNKSELTTQEILQLNEFDALVWAYPLYVDGIPSHLLSCLELIKQVGLSNNNMSVYCVVNSGFYEGNQNVHAIELLKNWCKQVGLPWGMGLGIGGGGSLSSMRAVPLGNGPKKSIGIAFNKLVKSIEENTVEDDIYVSVDFPRSFYKIGAHIGWKQQIKANGGKSKDLNYRY